MPLLSSMVVGECSVAQCVQQSAPISVIITSVTVPLFQLLKFHLLHFDTEYKTF